MPARLATALAARPALGLLFRRYVVAALLLPSSSGQLAQRTAQLAVTAGTDKDTDTRFVAPHLVASFDRMWRSGER